MEFLFPVKDIIGKGTGMGRLIPICPASTSLWNFLAWDPDLVKIAHPFPYSLLK
jgi:hypothetical protein